jgi:hypothetical protein
MYSTITSTAFCERGTSAELVRRRVMSHDPPIMRAITAQVHAIVALISTKPQSQ